MGERFTRTTFIAHHQPRTGRRSQITDAQLAAWIENTRAGRNIADAFTLGYMERVKRECQQQPRSHQSDCLQLQLELQELQQQRDQRDQELMDQRGNWDSTGPRWFRASWFFCFESNFFHSTNYT